MIHWNERSGDVWAWEKVVSGDAPEGCDVTALRLHGRDFDVERHGATFSALLPLRSGDNRITAVCTDPSHHRSPNEVVYTVRLPPTPTARAVLRVGGGCAHAVEHDRDRPRWFDDAVVYGVLPRKFGRPALRTTTEKLDSLKDLGVTTLWLSPVNTTIPHHAGYEVVDHFTIRADYGTEADFRELVQQAHERGMRVLMDFVPNHTSSQHPYYQDAEKYGARSVHYRLYDRDEQGTATHYFAWTWLPNLDFANPDVRRLVTEAMSFWVREYDVDGYRVDVAWGVKERAPDFWPLLRRELQRIKPDICLIAEASARDPYYVANGFDAAYDWTANLGEWAWQKVWTSPGDLVERLHAAVTNDGHGYPDGSMVFRFLNNNDTAERFLTRYGVGMTRVAAVLLLTLHGTPGLYTGDEIGAEYHPYDDIEPLDWDADPHGLRPHYQRLVALRHELPSLRGHHFERVVVTPAAMVYAYLRKGSATDDVPAVVVLNFHAQTFEATLTVPELTPPPSRFVDRLSEAEFPVAGGTLALDMPAYSARILTPCT
jgi:cyclomaltodextrinase / maltogenic alpha-amylase / neopullulanase